MRLGPLSLHADARGLPTLEMLLGSQQAGAIRWIPPMLFQALCDFIGVIGQTLFDRDIAWALCEPATPASRPSTRSPSASPAGGSTEAMSGGQSSLEQRA